MDTLALLRTLKKVPNRIGNQRKIALREFLSLNADEALELNAEYQRDYVWTLTQKQLLIESLLLGYGIGNLALVYRNYDTSKRYAEVVDGKQRLSTIISFTQDGFQVYHEGEMRYFSDFTAPQKLEFKNTVITESFVDVSHRDQELSRLEVLAYFYRVNFAGTPQTEAHRAYIESQIERECALLGECQDNSKE